MSEVREVSDQAILRISNIEEGAPVGNKAQSLALLQKKKFRIPETFVCPFDEHKHYLAEGAIRDSLLIELDSILSEKKKYSLRSSANLEDSSRYTFAGQFKTILNVSGKEGVASAIEEIWKSSTNTHAYSYRSTLMSDSEQLKMAVIIQEMIQPQISGVVFTRNPITGLDEIIVELVEGYGTTLVQDGVTPERWVKKWESWIEIPIVPQKHQDIVEEVITQARAISKIFGIPVDLEWAYDGKDIYWMQMREITTLRNLNIYSNKISREFLPGMIKPLIWSVNIPVVNNSWKSLFSELIGGDADKIDIHRLTKSFYYRAYFNMGIIGNIFELLGMPREALEILAGIETEAEGSPGFRPSSKTMKYIPRILFVALRKLFFSHDIERFIKYMKRNLRNLSSIQVGDLSVDECIVVIDSLFEINKKASYFVIVSQLLNSLYNVILSARLESQGIDIQTLRFEEVNLRLRPIDPRYHLSKLSSIYANLPEELKDEFSRISIDNLMSDARYESLVRGLKRFLKRFGHLSDSGNDFSTRTWRESPDIVRSMIMGYETREPLNDSENRRQAIERIYNNRILRFLYQIASKYREYRESVNFLYIYGYGQFRKFFLRIADIWVTEKILLERDDIFYLDYSQIQSLHKDINQSKLMQKKILGVKEEIEKFRDVVLPQVIYGELPESAVLTAGNAEVLSGVATSKGHYIGPVCAVRGVEDFAKINEGDVLVIPFSDVSWTPLFSKAKAVVSESGGILSHCSIVAREYQIPAVVSVSGAMNLRDKTVVAVDGYNGEVKIMES
jgi:phosphohistidine swiveling domain-containing protein